MPSLKNNAVVVVGDVMIDCWLYGDYDRETKEYGESYDICNIQEETISCGGAANVARHIKSLGLNAFLIGAVGNDLWGREFPNLCHEMGVGNRSVIDPSRKTTIKTRVISNGVNYTRFDREDRFPLSSNKEEQIIHRLENLNERVKIYVISDYNKGVITEKIVKCVVGFGKPVIVDLKYFDPKICAQYEGVTLIKPNSVDFGKEELKAISFYAPLAVTYGEDGIVLKRKGEPDWHFPSWGVPVKDAVGCGDAVLAGMAVGIYNGLELENVISEGNLAGAVAVTQEGTLEGVTSSQMDYIQQTYQCRRALS